LTPRTGKNSRKWEYKEKNGSGFCSQLLSSSVLKKIPDLMKGIGQGVKEFKNASRVSQLKKRENPKPNSTTVVLA